MAALLSDLPIQKVIMDAEEKHGHETHMVIECVSKGELPDSHTGEETEDLVYWWVEFENQIKTFETFSGFNCLHLSMLQNALVVSLILNDVMFEPIICCALVGAMAFATVKGIPDTYWTAAGWM